MDFPELLFDRLLLFGRDVDAAPCFVLPLLAVRGRDRQPVHVLVGARFRALGQLDRTQVKPLAVAPHFRVIARMSGENLKVFAAQHPILRAAAGVIAFFDDDIDTRLVLVAGPLLIGVVGIRGQGRLIVRPENGLSRVRRLLHDSYLSARVTHHGMLIDFQHARAFDHRQFNRIFEMIAEKLVRRLPLVHGFHRGGLFRRGIPPARSANRFHAADGLGDSGRDGIDLHRANP